MAKKAGLSSEDLQIMNMGQILDYITEWVNQELKTQEQTESDANKKAGQSDFDNF